MIVPAKTLCTFCKGEIHDGTPFAKVVLPIPPGADTLVPRSWPLEVCVGCITGILPDLTRQLVEEIRTRVQEGLDARRRAEAAGADLNDTFEVASNDDDR